VDVAAVAVDDRTRALAFAVRLGESPFAFCLRYDAPWRFLFGAGVGRAQLLFRAAQPAISLFDSRYRFRALTTYLEKFVPTGWAPRYVALSPAWPTLRVIRTVSSLL
jgi:hypothetical protein